MRRIALAASPVIATVMATGLLASAAPAAAQTVADYQTALAEAPIADPTAPATAELCRPLMNFVYVEIAAEHRAHPWYTRLISAPEADATAAPKRAACLEVRRQALIDFGSPDGEPIVTPPKVRDPDSDRMVR